MYYTHGNYTLCNINLSLYHKWGKYPLINESFDFKIISFCLSDKIKKENTYVKRYVQNMQKMMRSCFLYQEILT